MQLKTNFLSFSILLLTSLTFVKAHAEYEPYYARELSGFEDEAFVARDFAEANINEDLSSRQPDTGSIAGDGSGYSARSEENNHNLYTRAERDTPDDAYARSEEYYADLQARAEEEYQDLRARSAELIDELVDTLVRRHELEARAFAGDEASPDLQARWGNPFKDWWKGREARKRQENTDIVNDDTKSLKEKRKAQEWLNKHPAPQTVPGMGYNGGPPVSPQYQSSGVQTDPYAGQY